MRDFSKLEPQGDEPLREEIWIGGVLVKPTEEPDESDGEAENATDD